MGQEFLIDTTILIYYFDNHIPAHAVLTVDEILSDRRRKQIKLPDAVIAATCLINHLTLVTRNQDDFRGIKGLELYNPFTG